MKIVLIIGLAWLLLSGSMIGCVGYTPVDQGASPSHGPAVGKLAPDFTLPALDAQAVTLSDFRGRPVLLNFWATWCGPCRAEMPFLQQAYQERADEGLVLLAVDIQENPETVRQFAGQFGLSFTILLAASPDVPLDYNIRSIPTTFFIDENGIIQAVKIGPFTSAAEIERGLDKIMP